MTHKKFVMTKDEFVSALCRFINFEKRIVPRFIPTLSGDSEENFKCGCDRNVKLVDPFIYHMMGCKVGTNAIWLHDEVVINLVNLFRSVLIDSGMEPLRLMNSEPDLVDRRRPDI